MPVQFLLGLNKTNKPNQIKLNDSLKIKMS